MHSQRERKDLANKPPILTSLGGVWLDEIRKSDALVARDIVGGSATYAILGARLFNSTTPEDLQLIVNAGHDFPESVLEQLQSWQIRVNVIKHDDKPSTRGVLDHRDDGGSVFTRLTPPLLTQPEDLDKIGALDSKILHMFGDPKLAQDQITTIKRLRQQNGLSGASQPLLIWEPHPKSCTGEHYDEYVEILKSDAITVFSPNHHEMKGLLSNRSYSQDRGPAESLPVKQSSSDDETNISAMARSLRFGSKNADLVIIIRAAEHGCLALLPSHANPIWLPAFFGSSEQSFVVDTTGAGNAFLGGLAQGWLETGDWLKAVHYATVAASIMVQQIGVPTVSHRGNSEFWHGIDVRQRLIDYSRRADVRQVMQFHAKTM